MNDIVSNLHNTAMDLVDFARIKKAGDKDGDVTNQAAFFKAAYEIELWAISRLGELKNDKDRLRKATLLRNAGWLAVKCGNYLQALKFAELGLKTSTDGYELAQLAELKRNVIEKLTYKNIENGRFTVSGILIAADIKNNQIIIEEEDSKEAVTLSIPKEQIIQLVSQFFGNTVEIELQKDEKGLSILKDIRLAA